ncbi:hypothetical protein [Halomarina oriensis]|uniref:Uncharacterized protein n=1 Tax=Halomarina oriensis TaxID=671145 RepID=A0A6B0GPJ0_9EURY|nr:hypothetical protein [Halomarina oriensis]MWG34005.1 hypothetical protein [Halomarina oriensis]
MPSLTLAALSGEVRYVLEATFTAFALFVLFTLFAPNPTDPLVTGPSTAVAVVGGFAVASIAVARRRT